MATANELGNSKVCVCWVPQKLTDVHKKKKRTVTADLSYHTTLQARASCHRLALVAKPVSTF
jgi:hypothetical protein